LSRSAAPSPGVAAGAGARPTSLRRGTPARTRRRR
jgi:hypothetical protein